MGVVEMSALDQCGTLWGRDEGAIFLLLLQVEHGMYLDGFALTEVAQTVRILASLALEPGLSILLLIKQA